MPSYNKVILVGHITRDPQLKQLPNGTAVAEFGIATNRKWRDAQGNDKEDVCFVDLSCFGKAAEVLNQYVRKGDPLLVDGRLKLDSWEDKNGGGKRSKLSVIVENFQFLKGRDAGQQQEDETDALGITGGGKGSGGKFPVPQRAPKAPPQNPIGNAPVFAPEDVPF